MIYFTSDTHFFHKRVIEFGYRPFTTLDEMTEELIKRWNTKVKAEDTIFIVGDFSFKGATNVNRLFKRLNGNKIFIAGNHDKQEILLSCYINILGKEWEVIHNPDDSSHTNIIHGHIHLPKAVRATRQKNGRLLINVNTELWDYTPVSIKQIAKEIQRLI